MNGFFEYFKEKPLRSFWNCIEYAAHQRNAWNETLSDWVGAWNWRGFKKIIKRLWRTTCVDFYWLIDRNYFHWLMVEITRSLFEKYLSENWWARFGVLNKALLILNWRVWSWLRLNAGGRLNTCKSSGER